MRQADASIAGASAIIVPFDGFLALTAPLRAEALRAALVRHAGADDSAVHLEALLGGRTIAEAARHALGARVDETLVDLVALDASRAYARELAHGMLFASEVAAWLERQALRSLRLVARADSTREETHAILEMSGFGALFSFVRCSDDAPRAPGVSSAAASWQAIDQRLGAASIPVARRKAIEPVEHVATAAAPFVASLHAGTF